MELQAQENTEPDIITISSEEEEDDTPKEPVVIDLTSTHLDAEVGSSGTNPNVESSVPRFYEDKETIPIHSTESVNYSAEDAIGLFFSVGDRTVCTTQPIGCRFSATFIVDLSKLSHRDDIRADDLGTWKNCGVRSIYCSVFFNSDGCVRRVTKMGHSKPSVLRHSIYRLKRTYWQHSEDSTFCRRLLELEDFEGMPHRLCILQYVTPQKVSNAGMRPHKNSKNDSVYVRTKKSVLMQISDAASESKPMQVFDKVYESCGGVVGATSCGSVPRNIKQISNVKLIKKEPGVLDPLFAVMEECKKEQSHANPFIRVVNAAPEPMCVLARDCQLNDMARFCTDSNKFCIVGVDPTFNLGDFSVTVTTYRHLQLLHRVTKKHPVMLGPMLVHQNKTFESYHFLASSIVGLCPKLSSIKAFGTDGEKPLGDAFAIQFRDAKHLLCFLHVKERIKLKLRNLRVGDEFIKLYLNDIFGQQEGDHLFCGLVDCDSDDEFDEHLLKLEETWNDRELSAANKYVPEFHAWFTRYQASNMKSKMLKGLRKVVGLGDPPVHYTNNANVLATAQKNGVLKDVLDWHKSESKQPNMWSLARSSGVPKHPGDKPHCSKRKRSRVSRQPPKTCSKPRPPSSASPGNSPNPKRDSSYSGNSLSVSVSQAGTVSTSFNCQSDGFGSHSGSSPPLSSHLASGSEWSSYGNSYFPTYTPPPPWYQTPMYPFPPLPGSFSPPPYMGYRSPEANLSAPSQYTPLPSSFSTRACVNRSPELSAPAVRGQFTLKFINSRISKCQGCKGLLRSPGTPLPLPPYDLIVSRLECRPYMTPEKVVKVPKTPSNAHYHLRVECMTATDPDFNPRSLVVPEELKGKLSVQHKALLSSFFSA